MIKFGQNKNMLGGFLHVIIHFLPVRIHLSKLTRIYLIVDLKIPKIKNHQTS